MKKQEYVHRNFLAKSIDAACSCRRMCPCTPTVRCVEGGLYLLCAGCAHQSSQYLHSSIPVGFGHVRRSNVFYQVAITARSTTLKLASTAGWWLVTSNAFLKDGLLP
eukprot:1393307-Amphidinium_carterae.1